jgi:hypothetical protein
MALEKVTHIEGLSAHEDHELFDDTRPDSVLCRFFVKREEMPFATAQEGRLITQNFIYVERQWELGRSCYARRIRDHVAWNEALQKWEIKKLAEGSRSDIKRNPDEWNAFYRNAADNEVGTPLSLLFKNDPSRVEVYSRYGINTIDRLAALNATDIDSIGMGARDDQSRARAYIERAKTDAGGTQLNHRLELAEAQNETLQRQLKDMEAKLTEVLQAQVQDLVDETQERRPRGRPRTIGVEA